MATRLRARRVTDIFRDAQTYLHTRVASLEHTHAFNVSKKPVKDWLESHGTEDDDGNLIYQFPRHVRAVDEKIYSGVMLRKSVGSATMDDTEVMGLLIEAAKRLNKTPKELQERVFRVVMVLDVDEVYVLQQEGIITEDELRGLLHYPKPTYSLWPVEATEELEDEDD